MAIYYVRNDGTVTAANKANAIDPSSPSTSLSVTEHNLCTFSAADIVYLSSAGGPLRGGLEPPTAGVTYLNVPDEFIEITSRRLVSTSWSEAGGIYSTDTTESIIEVFWAGASTDEWGSEITENTSTPTTPSDGEWGRSGTTIYYNPSVLQPTPDDTGAFFEYTINTSLSGFSSAVKTTLRGQSRLHIVCTRSAHHGVNLQSTSNESLVENITCNYNGNETTDSPGIGNGIQIASVDSLVNNIASHNNEDHGCAIERITGLPKPYGVIISDSDFFNNKDAGATIRGGTDGLTSGSYVRCNIYNNGSEGEYAKEGLKVFFGQGTVEKSRIFDNNGAGIKVLSSDPLTGGTLNVVACEIYGNNTGDNDFTSRDLGGISVHYGYLGTINIYDSTIYGLGSNQRIGVYHYFDGATAPTKFTILNNIIYGHQLEIVSWEDLSTNGSNISNNMFADPFENQIAFTPYTDIATWNALAFVGTDLSDDPLFVDAAANNFHLLDNSPCYEAATRISGVTDQGDIVGNDYLGAEPDIGAYNYIELISSLLCSPLSPNY